MSELCLRSSNNPPKKTTASEAFPRISEKKGFPRANLFTPSAGSPSSAKACYAKCSDISSDPPAAKVQVTSTLMASASISDGFLPPATTPSAISPLVPASVASVPSFGTLSNGRPTSLSFHIHIKLASTTIPNRRPYSGTPCTLICF